MKEATKSLLMKCRICRAAFAARKTETFFEVMKKALFNLLSAVFAAFRGGSTLLLVHNEGLENGLWEKRSYSTPANAAFCRTSL
jgi:hypothetical protein